MVKICHHKRYVQEIRIVVNGPESMAIEIHSLGEISENIPMLFA